MGGSCEVEIRMFMNCYPLFLKLTVLSFLFSFQRSINNDDSFSTLKKLHLKVLKANIIGKEFEYNLTGQEVCNKTKLIYLGMITTKKRKQYKLLNSFWVTGYSCRGISKLVVYDTNNVYVGHYRFENSEELPKKLVNNDLVFNSESSTRISFHQGLPKNFLVDENSFAFESN